MSPYMNPFSLQPHSIPRFQGSPRSQMGQLPFGGMGRLPLPRLPALPQSQMGRLPIPLGLPGDPRKKKLGQMNPFGFQPLMQARFGGMPQRY